MSRILVGICGVAGCGKDTVFALLKELHPKFERMAFADPLKSAAGTLFGWESKDLFKNEFKNYWDTYWGLSVRDAYQRLGTECMRANFGDDFWVKRWELEYLKSKSDVIMTDVRFDNEADYIRKAGGQILHLYRDGSGLKESEGEHASEAGVLWDTNDYFIENNSTMGDLMDRTRVFLQYVKDHSVSN